MATYRLWGETINSNGLPIDSVTVTVKNPSTGSTISIYSDDAGTSKSNPFTTGADGIAYFYVDTDTNARIKVELSKTGYDFSDTNDKMLADILVEAGGAVTTLDSIGNVAAITEAQGQVLYVNGSSQWAALDPGTSGYVLTSQGVGADPVWSSAGAGDLLANGTVPLTANWDAGSFEIRAQTFESDVTTGTAPLTIASTTVVTNLNADKLDGADLIDEDDMLSDSAVHVPTQQSVKAYVDNFTGSANITTIGTLTAGLVPIGYGGTGQTTQTAAFDALAPTTTKGDLIVFNGSDNVRVAVGTNDYVLVADSTEAAGVKWAANPGVGNHTLDGAEHTNVATMTEAQGQLMYVNASTQWDALDPGTAGYYLKTMGAGADPVWAAITGGPSTGRHSETFTSQTQVVVAHNLGAYPVVAVYDASDIEIEASVTHNSVNQCTVDLNESLSGRIVCVSGGVTQFIDMEDAPANYTGSAGKFVKVNSTPDAVEFASITVSDITALTADRALQTSGAGVIEVSAVTATELGYLDGVTSAIQTQLDGKQASNATLSAVAGGTYTGDDDIVTVGTLSAGDATAVVSAASTTAAGKVELATTAEVDTGTDTSRAITPDALAGSNYGEKGFCIAPFDSATDVETGNGEYAFTVPSTLNGWDLVDATASVHTQGVTGTTDIQLRRRRSGSDQDMLSTKITIGAEYFASDGVINSSYDDVNTGDQIYVDVDAVHSGTAPKGLSVVLVFRLP